MHNWKNKSVPDEVKLMLADHKEIEDPHKKGNWLKFGQSRCSLCNGRLTVIGAIFVFALFT